MHNIKCNVIYNILYEKINTMEIHWEREWEDEKLDRMLMIPQYRVVRNDTVNGKREKVA